LGSIAEADPTSQMCPSEEVDVHMVIGVSIAKAGAGSVAACCIPDVLMCVVVKFG